MVVGFMFNENETDVLLIQKNKPDWQKGKMNGIGGKVEGDETYKEAMIREFKEECGIECKEWNPVILMFGDGWEVQVYSAKSDDVFYFKQTEKEKVFLIPINELDAYSHVDNLRWLIPMCLDTKIDYNLTNINSRFLIK